MQDQITINYQCFNLSKMDASLFCKALVNNLSKITFAKDPLYKNFNEKITFTY